MANRQRNETPVNIYFCPWTHKVIVEDGDELQIIDSPRTFQDLKAKLPRDRRVLFAAATLPLDEPSVGEDDAWNNRGVGKHAKRIFADYVVSRRYETRLFDDMLFLEVPDFATCPVGLLGVILLHFTGYHCVLCGVSAGGLMEIKVTITEKIPAAFLQELQKHRLFFPTIGDLHKLHACMKAANYEPDFRYEVIPDLINISGFDLPRSLALHMQAKDGLNGPLLYRLYLLASKYQAPTSEHIAQTRRSDAPFILSIALFVLLQARPGLFNPWVAGGLKLTEYPNSLGTCYASSALRLLQANETFIRILPTLTSDYAQSLRQVLTEFDTERTFNSFLQNTQARTDLAGGKPPILLQQIAQKLIESDDDARRLQDAINTENVIRLCVQCKRFEWDRKPIYRFEQRVKGISPEVLLSFLTQHAAEATSEWATQGYIVVDEGLHGKGYTSMNFQKEECPFQCGAGLMANLPVMVREMTEPRMFSLLPEFGFPNSFSQRDHYTVIMRMLHYENPAAGDSHVRNLIYARPDNPAILLDDADSILLPGADVDANLYAHANFPRKYPDVDLVVAYPTSEPIPALDYLTLTFMHPSELPTVFKKALPLLMPESAWLQHFRDMLTIIRVQTWS